MKTKLIAAGIIGLIWLTASVQAMTVTLFGTVTQSNNSSFEGEPAFATFPGDAFSISITFDPFLSEPLDESSKNAWGISSTLGWRVVRSYVPDYFGAGPWEVTYYADYYASIGSYPKGWHGRGELPWSGANLAVHFNASGEVDACTGDFYEDGTPDAGGSFNFFDSHHEFSASASESSQTTSSTGTLASMSAERANTIETETAKVAALSGAPLSVVNEAKANAGAYDVLNATGPGQYVTYSVPGVAPGTYQVFVRGKNGPSRGIFQLSISGVNQGAAQDEYASTPAYTVRNLGIVTFMVGGNKNFRFSTTGKNVNSGGFSLALDDIKLLPTTGLESEFLKVASITPAPSGISPAQWSGTFKATGAHGGAGTYFNAVSYGNYITYTVPVAKAGNYRVLVGIQRKPNKGQFQLAINGVNQGVPCDEYDPGTGYDFVDLGSVYLTAGKKPFKFTVVGKNVSSSGYTLAFDYIDLAPE
jgi:hypothetical protein